MNGTATLSAQSNPCAFDTSQGPAQSNTID